MTIRFFSNSDRYRELSNFANYRIEVEGTVWRTTEHYYQAQKFDDPDRQERIRQLPVAAAAKRYATKHKAKIRADWNQRKDGVMERALRAKFTQHESLRDLLVGSGNEKIEEDSPKDAYWGTGPDGTGQNRLGEMLMRLRAELRRAGARLAPDRPLFAWLGRFARLTELGTEGYPRNVRRRLAIVNVMAFMIAIFSAIYAVLFAAWGVEEYMPLILVNVALVVFALLVPLAHRFNDVAAAVLICAAEYVALFFFVRELGRDSGIQINYIIVAAVAFAVCGMAHIRLVVGAVAVGLALHLATWFLYPPENARIAADPLLLHNLYISSAATTFTIIALIVGYAFTTAERARAEADALLANILPEPIAERLKARPGGASRLESHGLPGEIQVSGAVQEALRDGFVLEPRGPIDVKGVGVMETWLLKAERDTARGTAA
jgi:adenylate cyclase